jgi:hypothetical protein
MRILRLSTPQARADALAAARPSCERRDVRLNDLFPIGPLPRGPFWWGRLGGEASAIYIYIFTFGSNGMYCTLLSTNGPLDLLGGCTTYPYPRYYMQFHIKPQHGGRRRQIYGERPSSRAAALRAWHWTRYCCVLSLSAPPAPMLVLLSAVLLSTAAPSDLLPGLPLANSTSVVFNSSFSPAGARAPVTCYRIPMIEQTADGTLVAFAEARLGPADKAGKIVAASCDDCVVNGIAQRRST